MVADGKDVQDAGSRGHSQPRPGVGHGQRVWGLRTALEWRPSLQSGLEGAK